MFNDVKSIKSRVQQRENKTAKAQCLANNLVGKNYVKPVYVDKQRSERIYYIYNNSKGLWEQKDINAIMNLAKEIVLDDFTNHFKREFKNQLENHEKNISYKSMGLDSSEILLEKGIVYNIEKDSTRTIEKQDYALNMINVDLETEKNKTHFKPFIEEIIPNEQQRKTVQEFLGWVLKYPDSRFQKALIFLGATNTGKSTLLKAFISLFEDSQTTNVSLNQICLDRRFHIPRLARSIVNIDMDMSGSKLENYSALKSIISQEEIYAENKGKPGIKVNPKAKLMIATNTAPNPSNKSDTGFYQRFIPIEFTNQIPEEDQDKTLEKKLTTPESKKFIFEWALQGLKRLEDQNGFTYQPDALEVRKKFNSFGSNVNQFYSECIETSKANNISTSDMYEYYELWNSNNLDKTLSKKQFINKLSSMPEINKRRIRNDSGFREVCFTNVDVSI